MKSMLSSFWNDQAGLSAVEYAIAGALVIAMGVVGFTQLGNNVNGRITDLATAVGS